MAPACPRVHLAVIRNQTAAVSLRRPPYGATAHIYLVLIYCFFFARRDCRTSDPPVAEYLCIVTHECLDL